ncbi:MAG: metallophosphoesterase family protein [Candidatus Ancaeobacter aquaticus]|nr:metallophosphoesterase family protein [Candidatus Ancaeobacter aquaticus]
MKYGILGDIHSNFEALETVHAYLKDKVDKFVSVGDIVGYAASPNECIEVVKGLGCPVVAGNHDQAVTGKTDITNFHPFAREAVIWTKNVIKKENYEFLASLDLIAHENDFSVVHASLDIPDKWTYIMSIDEADMSFRFQETKVCFLGHTHYPGIFRSDGIFIPVDEGDYPLAGDYKFIVNVGSIGQPRDGNPDACAVIYDTDTNSVNVKRLPYEIQRTQDRIIDASLPKIIAERLSFGR